MLTAPIHVLDLIRRKRDGLSLAAAEIQAFIAGVADPTLPGAPTEPQIAAFLMAVFHHGLSLDELAALTAAMRFSGEVLDPAPLHADGPAFLIDKHSTGGVGDKTSLLIAPIVAAAGLKVPMISGRALGHTGGTLDKLETIPGFRTQLSLPRLLEIVRQAGFAMAGQTPTLVPADRILYALRDHTATVESPPLITASIMSKKLAEGLDALVLDVKTGSGAFLRREEDARHLARLMVATGAAASTPTVAVLTRMDEPLGRYAGNWVEVQECLELFLHFDPSHRFRLTAEQLRLSSGLLHLTHTLSGWMLHLGQRAATPESGYALSEQLLASPAPYQRWLTMSALQSSDPAASLAAYGDPAAHHRPAHRRTLLAEASGYLASMDCTQVGWAVQRTGAGRLKPGDPVSPHAGLEMHAKIGDALALAQPLLTLFADTPSQLDESESLLRDALKITPAAPAPRPLIGEIITAASIPT